MGASVWSELRERAAPCYSQTSDMRLCGRWRVPMASKAKQGSSMTHGDANENDDVLACAPHRDAIVCGLRTGESNNLEDGIVDLYGVFSCGRLLNERADSPDDLACAIPLLDNKRERVIHLAKIRWLRA